MADAILTAERLRELLHYNQETGAFTRNIAQQGRSAGSVAGAPQNRGYIAIGLDYKKYLAHRLAWLYATGDWPANDIDHINGDRKDNRIANLRDVTVGVNNQNIRKTRSDNKISGVTGVYLDRRSNKWRPKIHLNGKQIYGGSFDTREEAHAKYLTMKRQYHEGFTM